MIEIWSLDDRALETLEQARARLADAPEALAWEAAAVESERRAASEGLPRNMSVIGSTAEIRVSGVLTKRPDYFAEIFGGGNTTYSSVRSALAAAASDPAIKSVVLAIDSPGGNVDGLFETLDAIASLRVASGKTLRVRAERAQSAAYGIAAAAGQIEAATRGAMFGSIGVAASYWVSDHVVTVTNTDSPDKRPDVTTDAGKAVVQRELDQINDELVRAIARGRGVTASAVTERFGRGASFTAPKALELGLIDRIAAAPAERAPAPSPRAAAIAAAEQRGVAQERERVLSHLAEASGDLSGVLAAIRSGAARGAAALGGAAGGSPSAASTTWQPRDLDAELRLALEASEAFDRRREAERRARAEPPATPGQPTAVDPRRPWVRP